MRMQRAASIRGFSFIELAIVMTLVGLIVATYLQEYRIYKQRTVVNATVGRVNPVRIAMLRYYAQNGSIYPCPADPALPEDDPAAGRQNCAATGGVTRVDGARNADVADPSPGGLDSVLTGAIPYVDLGLTPRDTYDGWGRRYGYAVTERLATQPLGDPDRDQFTDQGTIRLDASPPIMNRNVNPVGPYWGFVVWSYGSSMRGGYTSAGRMARPCDPVTRDSENCDGDATFLYDPPVGGRIRSLTTGADFYDGYVLAWQLEPEQVYWGLRGKDMNEAYNNFTAADGTLGRVGIKTKTPQEALDVNGNVRSAAVAAREYCDATGLKCFSARLIGERVNVDATKRAGTYCANDAPLTGLRNGTATCAAKVGLVIPPLNCEDSNKYAAGVNPDGSLKCVTPILP